MGHGAGDQLRYHQPSLRRSDSPERRANMEQRTPLRLLGTPDDVANAVDFLLSERASFITGVDLVVDGGWIIQTV